MRNEAYQKLSSLALELKGEEHEQKLSDIYFYIPVNDKTPKFGFMLIIIQVHKDLAQV